MDEAIHAEIDEHAYGIQIQHYRQRLRTWSVHFSFDCLHCFASFCASPTKTDVHRVSHGNDNVGRQHMAVSGKPHQSHTHMLINNSHERISRVCIHHRYTLSADIQCNMFACSMYCIAMPSYPPVFIWQKNEQSRMLFIIMKVNCRWVMLIYSFIYKTLIKHEFTIDSMRTKCIKKRNIRCYLTLPTPTHQLFCSSRLIQWSTFSHHSTIDH